MTGTTKLLGGFALLSHLPAAQFEAPGIAEDIFFRKNFRPFRICYTYALPGSSEGVTTYTSDIVNARLIFEHFSG